METIQFLLSIGLAICSAVMFFASLATPSPMKWLPVIIFAIIFVGCINLVKMSYEELNY